MHTLVSLLTTAVVARGANSPLEFVIQIHDHEVLGPQYKGVIRENLIGIYEK